MPTLNKRQGESEGDQSKWFLVTAGADHPLTFQIKPEGYRWLLNSRLGHKSNVGWDIFETLRALGMLYTLDSPYTPDDAPIPESFEYDTIPLTQRVNLAIALFDDYTAVELCEQEATFQFLLSFRDVEWKNIEPLLETVLAGTPFSPIVVFDHKEAFREYSPLSKDETANYSSILLSLFLRVTYDALEPIDDIENIDEGDPIWTYDGWIVCAGTELIFYEINDIIEEALPMKLASKLGNANISLISKGINYEFLEYVMSAISQFQFVMLVQDINPTLGSLIEDGLPAGYPSSILILPAKRNLPNGPFEYSTA